MPSVSRRHALQAVAAGLTALAGCADTTETAQIEDRPDRRSIEDYTTFEVRNTNGEALFTQRDDLPEVDGERDRTAQREWSVIVTADGLEKLTFADSPSATQLREFVATTDFSKASIYLFAMPLKACYELRLTAVAIETDELRGGDLHPHADFCRTYKPADVDCEPDVWHTVGFAIRLPVAAERSSGMGRGMSSSCDPSAPRVDPFDPNLTAVNESDPQ